MEVARYPKFSYCGGALSWYNAHLTCVPFRHSNTWHRVLWCPLSITWTILEGNINQLVVSTWENLVLAGLGMIILIILHFHTLWTVWNVLQHVNYHTILLSNKWCSPSMCQISLQKYSQMTFTIHTVKKVIYWICSHACEGFPVDYEIAQPVIDSSVIQTARDLFLRSMEFKLLLIKNALV